MTEKTAAVTLQEKVLQLIARLKIVEKQRNAAMDREAIAEAKASTMQVDSGRRIASLEKRIAELKGAKCESKPGVSRDGLPSNPYANGDADAKPH